MLTRGMLNNKFDCILLCLLQKLYMSHESDPRIPVRFESERFGCGEEVRQVSTSGSPLPSSSLTLNDEPRTLSVKLLPRNVYEDKE